MCVMNNMCVYARAWLKLYYSCKMIFISHNYEWLKRIRTTIFCYFIMFKLYLLLFKFILVNIEYINNMVEVHMLYMKLVWLSHRLGVSRNKTLQWNIENKRQKPRDAHILWLAIKKCIILFNSTELRRIQAQKRPTVRRFYPKR